MNDFDNLSEKSGASVPVAERVPIYRKVTLTVREAAEYSNIGINKIDSMLRSPNCPFVLFVGTKKLVKRCEFEEYIRGKLVI
jgi:excisionase family DNA binding protein